MSSLRTFLALDPQRWRSITSELFFVGAFTVFGTSMVLAFNRFGALLIDAPQEFAQLGLWVIWGWIFLGTSIWWVGKFAAVREGSNADQPSLATTLTSVGFAHRPMLVLGAVIFVTTGLFRVNGPGMVVAAFVFVIWLPILLTLSVEYSRYIRAQSAFAVIALPYILWLAIFGRHVLSRIWHLL